MYIRGTVTEDQTCDRFRCRFTQPQLKPSGWNWSEEKPRNRKSLPMWFIITVCWSVVSVGRVVLCPVNIILFGTQEGKLDICSQLLGGKLERCTSQLWLQWRPNRPTFNCSAFERFLLAKQTSEGHGDCLTMLTAECGHCYILSHIPIPQLEFWKKNLLKILRSLIVLQNIYNTAALTSCQIKFAGDLLRTEK